MRLPLLPLIVAGCAASFDTELADANGPPSSSPDSGVLSPPDTSSTSPDEEIPLYWSILGELRIVADEIEVPASELQIDLWSADLDLLCSLDIPTTDSRSRPLPTTEPPLLAWWAVDYDDGASLVDPGCGSWNAGTLELGVGPYAPQLDPAMDARDLLNAEVYGLYLRESPKAPVYVVGFVATNNQLLGLDGVVAAPPLPDGRYRIESLVVLSL